VTRTVSTHNIFIVLPVGINDCEVVDMLGGMYTFESETDGAVALNSSSSQYHVSKSRFSSY